MRRLLSLDVAPTAVFVAGDEMAVGAMHVAIDAGLDVPGDISIVGYDDVEIAALVRPSLTTVRQDYLGMGRAAVAMLSQFIDHEIPASEPSSARLSSSFRRGCCLASSRFATHRARCRPAARVGVRRR